ncbi:hypothetical protein CAPTEDRAFT_194882 [Capitella teleta]|uniref:Endonuclease/exonuclease/phosphatase domain-containing protein n=1 Tax=Capitella teleta TaxID=283909 RepID=R7TLQ6_CAPTE|nr:hypothetical protein CAPTEDRAFT_194882 [Capitella teleta]|eukprot:ELT94442.1 hypothetical protein CAPTEDRAFT_194882 [Capitella teleta]
MACSADVCDFENYTTERFKEEICKKANRNAFSLFHVNIRSLKKPLKVESLQNYINGLSYDFSVIGITETWGGKFEMEGYKHVHLSRDMNKGGGGISIYARNELQFKCLPAKHFDISDADIECTFIESNQRHFDLKVNVVVGIIYRPDSKRNETAFCKKLSDILDRLQQKSTVNRHIYLMGDLNVEADGKVIEMLESKNMNRRIFCQTRPKSKPGRVLDGIFTQRPCKPVGILDCPGWELSDHCPIFAIDKKNKTKN